MPTIHSLPHTLTLSSTRFNFSAVQVNYFCMTIYVGLQHTVQPRLRIAALYVHDGHGILLTGAIDTGIGLEVRFYAGHWRIPNNHVGSGQGQPV